jgi:hypothetical protein
MAANGKRDSEGKLLCPLCGTGYLRATDTQVFCSNQKIQKEGDEFINVGTCDFHIILKKSKFFGRDITSKEVVDLIENDKPIVNKKGDKLFLDLENENFLKIEYAPKKTRDL